LRLICEAKQKLLTKFANKCLSKSLHQKLFKIKKTNFISESFEIKNTLKWFSSDDFGKTNFVVNKTRIIIVKNWISKWSIVWIIQMNKKILIDWIDIFMINREKV